MIPINKTAAIRSVGGLNRARLASPARVIDSDGRGDLISRWSQLVSSPRRGRAWAVRLGKTASGGGGSRRRRLRAKTPDAARGSGATPNSLAPASPGRGRAPSYFCDAGKRLHGLAPRPPPVTRARHRAARIVPARPSSARVRSGPRRAGRPSSSRPQRIRSTPALRCRRRRRRCRQAGQRGRVPGRSVRALPAPGVRAVWVGPLPLAVPGPFITP